MTKQVTEKSAMQLVFKKTDNHGFQILSNGDVVCQMDESSLDKGAYNYLMLNADTGRVCVHYSVDRYIEEKRPSEVLSHLRSGALSAAHFGRANKVAVFGLDNGYKHVFDLQDPDTYYPVENLAFSYWNIGVTPKRSPFAFKQEHLLVPYLAGSILFTLFPDGGIGSLCGKDMQTCQDTLSQAIAALQDRREEYKPLLKLHGRDCFYNLLMYLETIKKWCDLHPEQMLDVIL